MAKFCGYCGSRLDEGARSCANCGAATTDVRENTMYPNDPGVPYAGPPVETKKKKWLKPVLALAAVVLVGIVVILFSRGNAGGGDFIVPVTRQTSVPDGYTGIYTAEELDKVRHDLSGNYILMGDIDLTNWGNWNPIRNEIGNEFNDFSGVFDGNGHVIKNMTVDMKSTSVLCFGGLFASISPGSEVKNLGIVGGSVSGDGQRVFVGGIAGRSDGTISNCYNSGNVSASGDEDVFVGGIAGRSDGTISNCYNSGNVSAPGDGQGVVVGGIAGGADGTISNCYNSGNVSASGDGQGVAVGGIAGSSVGTISNCYNIGNVSASDYEEVYAGGIVGIAAASGSISNCYYLDNIPEAFSYETPIISNASSLTLLQMQQQSSYAGFDFNSVWEMGDKDYPYPVLRK